MASKEEHDRYAAEFAQRFDALILWAISNWPNREFPLLQSDFNASRREISEILGPKLGDGNDYALEKPPAESRHAQYVDIMPMPWP